jgi:glycosyltransferase involved in cell wall biosynthesis
MKLSVVVPCYNEAKNIPHVLARFKAALKGLDAELILIDNNSKDETKKTLKELLPNYPFARSVFAAQPGYGAAIRKGLDAAKGEFLCYTHADMQTDPGDVRKALDLITSASDPKRTLVKGSRKGRPLADQFFTSAMALFESVWLLTILRDINAQPNMFHRSFLQGLRLPDDFSLDLYVLYVAKRRRLDIIRFPVLFAKRMHGESSWNTSWRSKLKFIRRTLAFSLRLRRHLNGGR